MTVQEGSYSLVASEQGLVEAAHAANMHQAANFEPHFADQGPGLAGRAMNAFRRSRVAKVGAGIGLTASTVLGLGIGLSGAPDSAAAVAQEYTVGAPSYTCNDDPLMIGSEVATVSMGGTRLWSDAMESPIADPSDATTSLSEIEGLICVDPVETVTVANMFANTTIDGVNLATLNTWLKPYQFDASAPVNDIKTMADSFFPTKNPDGSETTTSASITAFKELASDVDSELTRWEFIGEETYPTTENYQLSGNGTTAVGLPNVMLNPVQYNADAEWFTTTEKTGGCYEDVGFNVGDQRPEEAECAPPPPAPVTTTTVENGMVTTTTTHPNGTTTTTTQPARSTTTTSTPASTTTTKIGPKTAPSSGPGGAPTTSTPPATAGGSTPTTSTTSTTAASETTTTIQATTTAPSTAPAGGCGENCDN